VRRPPGSIHELTHSPPSGVLEAACADEEAASTEMVRLPQ